MDINAVTDLKDYFFSFKKMVERKHLKTVEPPFDRPSLTKITYNSFNSFQDAALIK